jgi:hypothetical protein
VDLWDMLKVAGRQWRVLVPMLVLTFSVALFVGGAIDPEYVAKGALVLVGPNETPGTPAQPASQPGGTPTPAGAPTPVNPYIGFSSSLPITAQALSVRVQSTQARDAIEDAGMSTSYTVTPDVRSPIIVIEARGQNSKQAVGTLNMLIDVSGEELNRMQTAQDVAESQLISLDVLDQNSTATEDTGTVSKLRIMVLGLGLVASITIAYVTEGFLSWRRERQGPAETGRHSRGGPPVPEEQSWNHDDRYPDDANGAAPGEPPRESDPWSTPWAPTR